MAPGMAGLSYAATAGTNGGNVNGSKNNADEDDELVDALERILQAEGNRRIMASSPSAYMQGGSAVAPSGGGPLTADELHILSLCCTSAATSRNKKPPPGSKKKNGKPEAHGGFASVEGDLLTTLTELLEKHVNLAVGVDLIQETVDVVRKREIKVDQVSTNVQVSFEMRC